MDLKGLSPAESAKLELKHPETFEVIPDAYLKVCGSDSRQYRAMLVEVARNNADAKDDTEAVYRNMTAGLAKLVVEISGLKEDGKPITDPVYLLTHYPWIRQQVDQFVMRRANFLQKA